MSTALKRIFWCSQCSMGYQAYETLTQHLLWKHGDESHACPECPERRWSFGHHRCIAFDAEGRAYYKSKRLLLQRNQRRPSDSAVSSASASSVSTEKRAQKRKRKPSARRAKVTRILEDATPVSDYKYCVCRKDTGAAMIACEAKGCRGQWFHFSCVNLQVVPEGDWVCPWCTAAEAL